MTLPGKIEELRGVLAFSCLAAACIFIVLTAVLLQPGDQSGDPG